MFDTAPLLHHFLVNRRVSWAAAGVALQARGGTGGPALGADSRLWAGAPAGHCHCAGHGQHHPDWQLWWLLANLIISNRCLSLLLLLSELLRARSYCAPAHVCTARGTQLDWAASLLKIIQHAGRNQAKLRRQTPHCEISQDTTNIYAFIMITLILCN